VTSNQRITVEVKVDASIQKVWGAWTRPEHIIKWSHASEDWHTTSAENDLQVGGRFSSRMEAKDGSVGFDFWGTYTELVEFSRIAYTMGDDRKAEIDFLGAGDKTTVVESFEPESENSLDLQRAGWQAILDNFKGYAEALG